MSNNPAAGKYGRPQSPPAGCSILCDVSRGQSFNVALKLSAPRIQTTAFSFISKERFDIALEFTCSGQLNRYGDGLYD